MNEPHSSNEAIATPQTDAPSEESSLVRLGLLALLVVVLYRFGGWGVVVFALLLLVVIFLHELGHYVTARSAGMKVTEFFIGFGPKLWSFRRGETEYGFKALPLGAYVRIIGMNNLDEVDPKDEQRTYRQKPYWRRLSVAVAGSTMHFVLALVLAFSVYVGFGVSSEDESRWTIGAVTASSPAEKAGIHPGDRIIEINGRTFDNYEDFGAYLRARPGETITVEVDRGGKPLSLEAALAKRHPSTGAEAGFLGVGPRFDLVRSGVVEGVKKSVSLTGETMWLSIKGIGSFFSPSGLSGYLETLTGNDSSTESNTSSSRQSDGKAEPVQDDDRVTSIVGIVQIGGHAATSGMANLFHFLFFINVFIGVFNLVPLLPFDGGHVVIATYEKLRSRKGIRYEADVRKLLPLTYAVVTILAVMFVSSAFLDITQPLGNPFE